MLTANIINTLQSLAGSTKQPAPPDRKVPAPAAKLEPGQLLQGTVQSKVSEGVFKVQVAGQSLQMRLPGNVQSGDMVRLQVVSIQPKITFSIAPSTTPLSSPEQIGSTARMLSNLSEHPIERPLIQQMGEKAVWAATLQAPDVKQLASGLREALSKSGLFYESHQAQWLRGERSVRQLLEEPQNILTGKTVTSSPGNVTQPIPERIAEQQPTNQSQPSKLDATGSPINKELLPLVQQQLHTLENHHMIWMGQVWPGQLMQWEIQGEPEHRRKQPNERQWSTEMELSLPRLGDVRAHLALTEHGLRLTLHATDSNTIELFNQSLPQLRDALDQVGISLSSAVIEKP